MRLQHFLGTVLKYSLDNIAADKDLSRQIQVRLIDLFFLDPPADGVFGPISRGGFNRFKKMLNIDEPGVLDAKTAEALIENKYENIPQQPPEINPNTFVGRILKYMQAQDYRIDVGKNLYNIVYVEGANADGSLNDDEPNEFNDRRLVIEIVHGVPKIVGNWQATTEPGIKFTRHPQNPLGAARIQFGQYRSWEIGIHKSGTPQAHEALVQVADVTVCRDLNKDYKRTGDKLDTGMFGINQHWGFDFPSDDIRGASAGCLVGRSTDAHRDFMTLIKQDKRYRLHRDYLFTTTIIPGDKL